MGDGDNDEAYYDDSDNDDDYYDNDGDNDHVLLR